MKILFKNAKVLDFIRRAGVKNLVDVQLFDIFMDDSMAGKKSMAYHLVFSLLDRSLTQEEVEEIVENKINTSFNLFKTEDIVKESIV